MHRLKRSCWLVLTLFIGACAPSLEVIPAATLELHKAPVDAQQPGLAWWQLRFKLSWPEGEEPDLSRHLLIAEQILLPVIVEHQQQMPLWRFHRRAARTPAGHQFSLIFLSDTETAAQINQEVAQDPTTAWLMHRQMLEQVRMDKRSKEELGQLEDTSDPSWPLEIQRSWPWFIMGASQGWLIMVQELSANREMAGEVSYPALLAHYRDVDAALEKQWRDYGQHAYLHHLNAVYGYRPIRIRSSELKTF